MATTSSDTHPHENPFKGFDDSVETLGVIEVAALGVVLTGFIGMLNEPGEDEAR